MIFYFVALIIVVLDQWSKRYMSELLDLCRPGLCETIEILPVFKLILLHNSGAAFSFLDDAGGWQRWFLVTVSTVVSAIIGVWLFRIRSTEKLLAFALCLILGGAVGNLIDRVAAGFVVDFLLVHWDEHYFPAFNVADAAISVGAGCLILDMFLKPKLEKVND
ncbi:signal peptidase II [Pseudomonadales bacterium]|nr:lipoprotein signal peptidase [Gammaproteobacteria bacterium]MBT3898187.1 lipoprotein signal peptidase [Gammaproteobacteria bacterium]MBT7539508.1 lipoprotein signal peptidase [Gammaproteobacteria bacterium]MDA7832679.1 signal peptidase II [Pseudomonadales bacterium]MDC1477946.1 signal peptidase II [Pseudomonadales bacterium]